MLLRDSDEEALTILIGGDFCPLAEGERIILGGNSAHFLRHVQAELAANDFSLINLEAPLTKSDKPILKNGPNLKADPRCVEFLHAGNGTRYVVRTTTSETLVMKVFWKRWMF